MRALVFIALLLLEVPASACSCGSKPTVSEAARDGQAIFVGRLMKLTIAYRKYGEIGDREIIECEFTVGTPLKGIETGSEKITIITASSGPACGYPFRIGREYLVYARRHSTDLETDVCMRTRPLMIVDETGADGDISKMKVDNAMRTEVPLIRAALSKI